jgi:hypothetical protein
MVSSKRLAKKYPTLEFRVKREFREQMQEHAARMGLSLASWARWQCIQALRRKDAA